ncbi:LOW QUALITY PROTEIN: uncharacterized protein LOC124754737 [Schistocerca piceifrons]|uniref:LOW QUALITY PROTEIN: uncharacterized protein LOC124754737 n=1 Tax=Schistocerca piceifrons TaxID=274613 RepID=UPI001F5E64F3|nr:LOW QUALITY PROTEIN: uncharacterized protein LOC124754737 [Schistocerca piceifrons]
MWSRGRDVQLCALVVVALATLQQAEAAALPPAAGRAGGCSVDINDESAFPDPQPLFLLPGGSADAKGFWEPEVSSELLTLQEGDQLNLACTGSGNVLTVLGVAEATATCVSGTTFSVDGRSYALSDLKCSSLPDSSQRDTQQTCGASAGVYPLLQIGFELSTGFVKLIDICFDDTRLTTLYAQETIVAGIGGYQSGFPRPNWMQGDFFGDIDVNTAYTKNKQRETISEILGSSELGDQYVTSGDYYLSRGHMSAKADWVFGSQQTATFWFLNAAPQWQTFNGANWETVESNVRYYARKKGADLTVYTGTYGVATLPNVDGVETELYLVADTKQIPVPKLYWKLVHDAANDAGVALIGINNPYVSDPGDDYYLCPDVCSKLSWVTWESNDQKKGFSYCCEVSEFQKVVSVLPEISVSSLPTLYLSNAPERAGGCSVDINDESAFPDPQPPFLLPGGSADAKGFWEPEVSSELLTLQEGDQLNLACTGAGNVLTALGVAEATATCVSGTTFSVDGRSYALSDLKCSSLPDSSQRDTQQTCGASAGVYPLLQIGFELSTGFVKVIDICFDDTRLTSLYVQAIIVVASAATIVVSLDPAGGGHLSAKADWMFGSQQTATIWFLNAASPQWQTFNGTNWETVESNVSYCASKKGADLTVYTGTYGVATLPKVDGVETELYLVADTKQIPVPKLYWKLVHDAANDAGVALIGINNPYVSAPGDDYYLCPDVCSKLSWVTWVSNDQKIGFSYCCEVSCFVDVNGSKMPDPQPLLLIPGGSKDVHGFVTPDSSGVISLSRNEQIVVACPDNSLQATGQSQATAYCVSGSTFSIDGRSYDFADLSCRSQPKPSGQKTGSSCGSSGQYQVIQLGFQVGADFYTLIDACFDDRSYNTVYDHSTMIAEMGGRQSGFDRPDWLDGGFFGDIDVDNQYKRATQIQTVGTLLGSSQLGSKYISETSDYFLSRGHLSAKADFILGALEYASFLYVNAAPQWQTFNGGNWNTLENNVRSYVSNNEVELEIYTGTHGITTLLDVNNVETELYLYADGSKYIPVPKIFWKIVYDANTKAAVVFVGVNNPYIENPGSDYFVCTDVCSKISWISWKATDQEKGYSYCCEYADFKNAVADAPSLGVNSLLT